MRAATGIAVTVALLAGLVPLAGAASGERVTASPRPVHFGQTLTVRGSGWPVIEFCRRKVKLTLTTSQQAFRIGAARVSDEGRFIFHWVPRRAKVGAGLWRLRARMRCESGKDGSTVYRRASVRFRIRN
jgi:hypothetical protein